MEALIPKSLLSMIGVSCHSTDSLVACQNVLITKHNTQIENTQRPTWRDEMAQ